MNQLKTQARNIAYRLLLNPSVRKFVEKLPFFRDIQGGMQRTHPFDKIYGVDTSGTFPPDLIQTSGVSTGFINCYLATTPSITRRALASLPDIEAYTFVDIGCGKGRALIVASEFPFTDIIGLELSPELAKIAQSNIDKIQRQFPDRPLIRVIEGNALEHMVLSGKVVFNIFHSFGPELMTELIHKIESALGSTLEHVFFIYQNPVWGNVLDASPAMKRWFADTMLFEDAELGFGDGTRDGVTIWQSVRGARAGACPGADREIVIVEERYVARIAP
ncbi:MAG: class I SAM-dependent methyltransferase [Methylocella sp.]